MTALETIKLYPLFTAELTLYLTFKLLLNIGLFIFLPWLVAYFYRKMNFVPWSVWEKNPNVRPYTKIIACQSDFKKSKENIL